jgi:hypothetical protein
MTLHKMKLKLYLGLNHNVADLVSRKFKHQRDCHILWTNPLKPVPVKCYSHSLSFKCVLFFSRSIEMWYMYMDSPSIFCNTKACHFVLHEILFKPYIYHTLNICNRFCSKVTLLSASELLVNLD